MLKIMERAIRLIVSDELDQRFDQVRQQIIDVFEAEGDRLEQRWDVKVYSIGANDIVVLPAAMTSEDFDRISKRLAEQAARARKAEEAQEKAREEEAKKLGVKVISEKEFLKLLK